MLELRNKPNSVANAAPSTPEGLRVAILSYRSDPKVGGQGVYVDYLASALAEMGAQVDVISGPPYPQLSGNVRLIKLPSLDLYAQPRNGHYALRPKHLLSATDTYEYFGHLSGKFVEPYTFGQRAFAYMKRQLKTYDVVLDNQVLSSGISKICSQLNIPLVTTIHHPITRDRKLALAAASDWRERLLVRRWYAFHRMQVREARKRRVITSPSDLSKTDIVAEFGLSSDRIHTIPLGVDQRTFFPKPNVKRAPRRIITMASSDTPLKGLHILLEAYHQILQDEPDTELVIIGTLRKGATQDTIRARNLETRVQFKSDLSREELADEFRAATVAVSPSLYEGFGLPAAEAMSCGTPVIVTDGGALPEVAGDAGIIVPRGDPVALGNAISEFLNDPGKRADVAAACLARALERFNWNRIAPKYLDLFEQAIAEKC